MTDIVRDLRLAARSLVRIPAFTVLSVLTIALGIGASTAIFSMVNGALLKPLPYAADNRVVRIFQRTATNSNAPLSVPEIRDYRDATSSVFEGLAEYHSMPFQFYGKGDPQRVQTGVVSDNFFTLLGVHPILGRNFSPGEDAVGAANVILLSNRYWHENFGGDSAVVGAKFVMNDRAGTIIGVLPPLPLYPNDNDIWMPAGQCPFRSAPAALSSRVSRLTQGFGVLKPGVTFAAAKVILDATSARLHAAYPEAYPPARSISIAAVPVRDELTNAARPLLYTLLASALFVLIIAAANFANLTLSRQLRRRGEFALRTALGAQRIQLFAQLATESLLVTLTGALLGVGIAYGGIGVLRTFATRFSARAAEISIDPAVLTFAIVTSVLVGLIAASLPMWKSGKTLSEDVRAGAAATTVGRRDSATRGVLVAMQVAVAFVVLTGAGLMVRSLIRMETTDGGYSTANVMTARIDLNWSRYTNNALVRDFSGQLMQRTSEQPGVSAVAVASDFPLNSPIPGTTPFVIRGREVDADQQAPVSDITVVSPSYFDAIHVPLFRGRVFTTGDVDTVNVPAVIGQRLATTYLPGKDPLGEQISLTRGRTWLTIVGVVGDVRQNGPAQILSDEIYLPYYAFPARDFRILAAARGNAAALSTTLRNAVKAIDPQQPIVSVQTLEELRGTRLTQPRVATMLLGLFAVISLVITAGGLGGVVAHAVTQRHTEIGIRLALGASMHRVVWSVTRNSAILVAIGLAIGLGTALAGTRLIRALLFEVSATDVRTFAIVAFILAAISFVACLIPARRALKVQPIEALRAR